MSTRAPGRGLASAALVVVLSAGLAAASTHRPPAPGTSWGAPGGQEKPPVPVPRPFPKPAEPAQTKPAAPQPGATGEVPSEATLGVPLYPAAQFLASYDAGQGQRYYLFGVGASFADVVAYYRSVLKQKGDLVFEEPPTWTFEIGRFDENKMAFPPGITVKDYAWGGLKGYLNPKRDGQPARFPTVLQVVPVPPVGKQP